MAALSALVLTFLLLGQTQGLEHGEVRLSAGRVASEGRVEIYYDGEWGTVCDDGWDMTDALVVCRSLGYVNATEASIGGVFGSGSGYILLDDVVCTGTETSLTQCKTKGWKVHDCQHTEDAGVRCDPRRLEQLFGYRLDRSAELYTSLEDLYESRWHCDMNITVTTMENGREQDCSCVHRLILSLHTDGNTISESQGSNFNMLVSQDCLQYVNHIIRYFYTKTIDVTLNSVKCIHNMASDYGLTAIRDHCDKLFYKLLPQDPSFQHQLELYNYAGAVKDTLLKEICMEYFAWNCEAFSQSVAWNNLSSEAMDTLLQRSDLVTESEYALFQAVTSWILHGQRMEVAKRLISKIRFPMMSPEELISIPSNCSLFKQLDNVFIPRMMEAFEFHSVSPQTLRYFRNVTEPSFQPRIYTSSAWSRTLDILLATNNLKYYQHRNYYSNNRYISSPRVYFQTAPHMSRLYSSSQVSWSAFYHQSERHCRNTQSFCPYDTYPVAELSTRSVQTPVTFHNQLVLLCNDSSVSYVQEMKNTSAVLPLLNATDLFACDTEPTAIRFVIRPHHV